MKEKLKKIWSSLIFPPLWLSITCYATLFIFVVLTFVGIGCNFHIGLMTAIYSIMGISFFYCCFLFIRYDYKKIKHLFRQLKIWLSSKNKFLNKLFNDIYFRTILFTSFSLFMGLCFVAYNVFVGLKYHSVWNKSIAVYYALLVVIKIGFLRGEYNMAKTHIDEEMKAKKRAKMFEHEGALMIAINFALIAPITLLATLQKDVDFPIWIAIADACYTFYKVSACIYSFFKTRKNNNLSIKGIKNLNLLSACVSLLTLENTMVITFSNDVNNLKLLMIFSALAVMILNMTVAITTLIHGKKINNKEKINDKNIVG